MKTLPKRVDAVLKAALGTYNVSRVLVEELSTGTIRCYVCGWCLQGFFAAYNEIKYFNRMDIEMYKNVNDAWNTINSRFV